MKRQCKEVCQLCSSGDSDQQQERADEEGTNCSHLACASGSRDGGLQEQRDCMLGLLESLGHNSSSTDVPTQD